MFSILFACKFQHFLITFLHRLWGENGQQALETSHVCLINATAAGTETLKSLVLPGIRAFTIIDDHRITEDDADSNFFLCTAEGSVLGEPRAKVAAQQLLEMNSDVKKGDWVEENFEALLDQPRTTTQPLFFTNFSLVVACGIESERALNKLSAHLWQLGVPLLVVKSLGFLGYLRLQVREHAVIEPHPDSHLEDLRLDAVWPELRAYFDSFPEELTSLSRKELSQVPALVIIYRGLLRWRKRCERESGAEQEEPVPANYREKAQLKALIVEEMERFKEKEQQQQKEKEEEEEKKCNDKEEEEDETDVQTGVGPALLDLENYEEALKMLNSVFTDSRRIPAGVQKLLDEVVVVADEQSHQQQPQPQQSSKNHHHSQKARPNSSASFWAMISALRAFVAQFGTLPLAGSLPDMNCGSEQYARLQRIYRAKARADAEALLALLQKQQQKTCATTSTANGAAEAASAAAVSVSEADLALFCRNARFLTVLRCAGPMAEELTTGSAALRALASCPQLQSGADEGECGEDGGSSEYDMLRLYLLMRLVERFTGKHNRHPGQRDDEVESDIAELKVGGRRLWRALSGF